MFVFRRLEEKKEQFVNHKINLGERGYVVVGENFDKLKARHRKKEIVLYSNELIMDLDSIVVKVARSL